MQTTKTKLPSDNNNASVISLILLSLFAGINNGYNFYIGSTLISLLRGENMLNHPIEEAFMNSSITFGCVFGCFIGGYMADAYGRKTAVIAGEIIVICGTIGHLIGNISVLLSFRLVLGFGLGICSLMKPMYIAELSNKSNRGAVLVVFSVASSIGMNSAFLLKSTTGSSIINTPWRWLVIVGIVPALALILLTIYALPESPEWLQMTNRKTSNNNNSINKNDIESNNNNNNNNNNSSNEENKSLLHHDDSTDEDEDATKNNGKKSLSSTAMHHSRNEVSNGIKAPFLQIASIISITFKEKKYFQPLALACLIGIANVFGGGTISMFELDYILPAIFTNATNGSNIVYVGIVHLIGVCAGIPLIDTVGRRPLLFIGLFGIFITSLALAILITISPTTPSSSFTTILFLIYMFLYQIGPQAYVNHLTFLNIYYIRLTHTHTHTHTFEFLHYIYI